MHGRMAGDGHGLLQVSLGPTMPYPSKPCGRPLWGTHGRMARGGHGLLQVSLRSTMSYPCTPCGQPPREGKGVKGKRKKKGGGECMGVWQGTAMDYLKYH
jgi:hypothetical protein